jgi:hypothetical protein
MFSFDRQNPPLLSESRGTADEVNLQKFGSLDHLDTDPQYICFKRFTVGFVRITRSAGGSP